MYIRLLVHAFLFISVCKINLQCRRNPKSRISSSAVTSASRATTNRSPHSPSPRFSSTSPYNNPPSHDNSNLKTKTYSPTPKLKTSSASNNEPTTTSTSSASRSQTSTRKETTTARIAPMITTKKAISSCYKY